MHAAGAWRSCPTRSLTRSRGAARCPMCSACCETSGYGILQLPPAGEHRLLLAVIADQVAEFAHHGYAVVAIGVRGAAGDGLHWRQLASLLRHRAVTLPPRHILRPDVDTAVEGQRLAAFLESYDLPALEQHQWRL